MPKKTKETADFNPFVQSLQIKAIWRMSSRYESEGRVVQSKPYEVEHRVHFYTEKVQPLFATLPNSAINLFMWIAAKLRYESDVIEIDPDRYCKEMEVSMRTFYDAIERLRNKVIVPRDKRAKTYYVNPAYIYRGSRTKSYPNNIVAINKDPLEKILGKDAEVNSDNAPLDVPGFERPELFGPIDES